MNEKYLHTVCLSWVYILEGHIQEGEFGKEYSMTGVMYVLNVKIKMYRTIILPVVIGNRGQRPIWSQGLYRCWYVKPRNPEKTNRKNNGGSVGISYSHVHEG